MPIVRVTRRDVCLAGPVALISGGASAGQTGSPRVHAESVPTARIIDKFSHGIIIVQDMDAAVCAFESMGFMVERGGRYRNGGSGLNAYIRFGRAFLELLSMPDRDAARAPNTVGRAFQRLAVDGVSGLVAYGLGAVDIDRARSHFDRLGLPHYRIDQSMTHADGVRYGWTVFIIRDHPWHTPWPVVSRYDEVEEMRMANLAPAHPNGATRILSATIEVPRTAGVDELFGEQLGLSVGADGLHAMLSDGVRLDFAEASGDRSGGVRELTIGVADIPATRAFFASRNVALPDGDRPLLPVEALAGTRLRIAQI